MINIGERFNYNDVFFRDLTLCLLDTLEGQVRWVNNHSSGDRDVIVPFYYSLTGDTRFLMDAFVDDVVSDNRKTELNTDIIPRGIVTMKGFSVKSEEFANPNVFLKAIVEDQEEIRSTLVNIRAIPISAKYEVKIQLASEIDLFKCSQAILDTLWLYRFMYFEHNFMNIDAMLTVPDEMPMTISREASLTSDNKDGINISVDMEVHTYYPAYYKPQDISNRVEPRRTRWYNTLQETKSSTKTRRNNAKNQ